MWTWDVPEDDCACGAPLIPFWLGGKAPVRAERDMMCAVEARGKRWAVNEAGTRLFALDERNRIKREVPIGRPDYPASKAFHPYSEASGLAASPDGKHIIVFLDLYEGC